MNRLISTLLAGIFLILTSALALPSTLAQENPVWETRFYNNAYLQGTPVLRRQDSALAFNWGHGSPGRGVNVDNFTARFGTDVFLTEGTYRFYVLADDGVQLFVDFNNLIINTFNQPRPGQLLTADIKLGTGTHHLQVDYREVTGEALLYVSWANLATNPSGPNFPVAPAQPPAPINSGTWTAQYYSNPHLSGNPVAIMSEIGPSHNWGQGAPLNNMPSDNFSARWTSSQVLEGSYQISVRADDGVRVLGNGVAYINEWHGATGQTYVANFSVPRGTHTITVEYYEAGGLAFLEYGLQAVGGNVPNVPVVSTGWAAQYYSNPHLAGSPSMIRSENGPSQNWGQGAPFAGMPQDNFSVRWTSVQALSAGNYRIDVRADDGVRVLVNGVAYINEWHGATGQTYSSTFSLPTGNHNFMIEYYEAGGAAFIDYSLTRTDSVIPYTPPPSVVTGASITVNANTLNVRNAPNAITGAVLTRISRGQSFPVMGRNVDSSWWQVNVNGTQGWVSGGFVTTANIHNVPVTNTSAIVNAPATGFTLTTNNNVNLRSGPATSYSIQLVIPRGQNPQIVGRNSNTTWWKVNFNGVVGWVSAGFVSPQFGLDLNRIPVTAN
jgi:uncharacterized protein YraI